MRLKTALLASAATAAVLAVAPANAAGAYVSIFGGWNQLGNDVGGVSGVGNATATTTATHITGTGPTATTHTDTITFNFPTAFANSGAKGEDGYVLGAAIGKDLSNWMKGLRGELEFAYRRSSLGPAVAFAAVTDTQDTVTNSHFATPFTSVNTATTSAVSGSGSVGTFTIMANAWYDFDMSGSFTPYVGGGVGYADNEIEHGLVMNGTGGDFAWQLGAGVNVPIGDKTSIGLGYRYLDAGDVTLTLAPRLGGPVPTQTYDITSHSVLVNLTFDLSK
jgi:opacity protein-like surface antigen